MDKFMWIVEGQREPNTAGCNSSGLQRTERSGIAWSIQLRQDGTAT